jgi:predicted unusual protein kinase regulating ubiquinone biosynthesis (AarF/ABC1/UbiB family)
MVAMSGHGRKVPASRLSRLAVFGRLAGGVTGGVLAEGARRLARGERPHLSDLLLTPANARRVTDQLARLRGAAMKLGQMLSMDAGDVLPAELTTILARLRDAAQIMPPVQLYAVLSAHWGPGWRGRFAAFEDVPIAAASIGQVHRARLADGRPVAVKVQYPGVAASIDADVDNVATLMRVAGLLPPHIDIVPLLAAAKAQLREETDYLREAEQMRRYRVMLADDDMFLVPAPVPELTGRTVLVMDFIEARPIEHLEQASQDERDRIVGALLDLVLRELFRFGIMQTDPNFANYRWQPESGRIVLFDFGATRIVREATRAGYRALVIAGLSGDHAGVRDALVEQGFVSADMAIRHRARFDAMIAMLLAHFGRPGRFDFSDRSFVPALKDELAAIMADRGSWHVPPAETLFVQRKISGTALLAARMGARVPVRQMLENLFPT